MSKKRKSSESSDDEQMNEGSDSVLQQDAKRPKLTPLSDTMLQDLPIELIQCILIKAVVMEVKGMKLAKSVWKEKSDLVTSRLETVCSQWSDILTTNFFRDELHRTLDDTEHDENCAFPLIDWRQIQLRGKGQHLFGLSSDCRKVECVE